MAAPVNQKTLERYQNDFYELSDVVYRFGVVLTGSRDGAERLTEETFRQLIAGIDQLNSRANATDVLMALAWQAWNKIKSERFHEWSQPTVNELRKLTLNEKASLYLVDMVGLAPKDAAAILGVTERDIREPLASARKRLASGEVSL